MALYGRSIKINAAVSAGGATGTIYTAPANGYAIINIFHSAGIVSIGTRPVSTVAGANSSFNVNATGGGHSKTGFYVGPGEAVSSTSNTVQISGVSFVNTA